MVDSIAEQHVETVGGSQSVGDICSREGLPEDSSTGYGQMIGERTGDPIRTVGYPPGSQRGYVHRNTHGIVC